MKSSSSVRSTSVPHRESSPTRQECSGSDCRLIGRQSSSPLPGSCCVRQSRAFVTPTSKVAGVNVPPVTLLSHVTPLDDLRSLGKLLNKSVFASENCRDPRFGPTSHSWPLRLS